MKAIYQKPVTRVGAETAEALMITASGDGETILQGGGGSNSGGITTSDSRRGKLWEDNDEDW